jgi:glycosyltransferase involved in cell wall biosynthesis
MFFKLSQIYNSFVMIMTAYAVCKDIKKNGLNLNFTVLIRVVSVVSNDIVTDNRIHKIALTLGLNGYEVTIVGRRLKGSLPLSDRPYSTKRFRLWFNKGPLFYLNLNICIFFYLLRSRAQIILSNDLDTLPGCYAASRILKKQLVFDSHELFPEVPELVHRPLVRKIWLYLESQLIRNIHYGFTVCNSIAEYYKNTYDVAFVTIRNMGRFRNDSEFKGVKKNTDTRIIIYQGALNLGRGLELAIESMKYLEGAKLWILGDGDIKLKLVKLAADLNLNDKVEFKGRVPIEALWHYTASADVGISLEENLGLNYQYALPNKLFDYIQARLPVAISDLPEMKAIVDRYHIGKVLEDRNPYNLADTLRELLDNMKNSTKFSSNIELAARELCWEREEDKLISLFKCVSISS